MGDSPPGPEKMADVLKAMQQNLPGVIQAITREQPGVAMTQAEVDRAVSPIYAQTQADIFANQGRQLAEVGREIAAKDAAAASASEREIGQTYGKDLASLADELQRIIDPEFYEGRERFNRDAEKLSSSMDPTKLSGSERAEIERTLARSGVTNPNSTAETVANATTFGKELQEKQARFGDMITQIASVLPATRTGISGFEVGTRRATTPNVGVNNFVGAQSGTGQNAWQTGNNVFNQASALQAIKAQKSTSLLDDVLKGTQAFGNIAGSLTFG